MRLSDADENDDDAQCTLVVSLMQKFARARRTTEKKDDTDCAIGFDIYKVKKGVKDLCWCGTVLHV